MIRNIAPILLLLGCGAEQTGPRISTTPVSIRGWLIDPAAPTEPQKVFHLSDTATGEADRRARMFEQMNFAVEGYPYASGAIAANGSFIILDVPPGDVTITFQPPGAVDAQLLLKSLPPHADVLLPALKIEGTSVVPSDPQQVVVRVAARVENRRPLATTITIAGHSVRAYEVPLREMIDRREFPEPKVTSP